MQQIHLRNCPSSQLCQEANVKKILLKERTRNVNGRDGTGLRACGRPGSGLAHPGGVLGLKTRPSPWGLPCCLQKGIERLPSPFLSDLGMLWGYRETEGTVTAPVQR